MTRVSDGRKVKDNMKKNDIIKLEITDVTHEGSGVGKYDGMAVFVPYTIVGERVRILIV